MNDMGALKLLMMRAFPGLGGWHVKRYGRILNVYPYQGKERQSPAMVVADIEVMKPNLKKDMRFLKPLLRVPLSSGDPWSDSMPMPGMYCLFEHPYWRADQAVVTGYLYTGRTVKTAPGVARLGGGLGVELGSGEDNAVLGSVLEDQLNAICDELISLAGSANAGGPLSNGPSVIINVNYLKLAMGLIKSPAVKVGAGP